MYLLQERLDESPQLTNISSKKLKKEERIRSKRNVVMSQERNIQTVNLIMNGIILAVISMAVIAIFGWTSQVDQKNKKINTLRHKAIVDNIRYQQLCLMQELQKMECGNLARADENRADIQKKNDILLMVFQEICKETRLSTPYPIKLTRGHTSEDFAKMIQITHWNKQWREDHNASLKPTAFFQCPRDLPKPQDRAEWKRLADLFYIEAGLTIAKPTCSVMEDLNRMDSPPINSIDQIDIDHLCRTPICIEPNVKYSGKEHKCQYCTGICCNCKNCETYRGFFQIRTAVINTGEIDTWDYHRQQLIRSINRQSKKKEERQNFQAIMKALYQEARKKQPLLPKIMEYLSDEDPLKEKIRSMAETIMEGPKIKLITMDKRGRRLAENLSQELLKIFLNNNNVKYNKMDAIMDWILEQSQKEDEMIDEVLTKGGSDVVVISDSNMSLDGSSSASLKVMTGADEESKDIVWIKEGSTTEDENSVVNDEE